MHLHDVFTPSEIVDGLTSASRVEKLLSSMNQDKHCFMKRTNKATRCWSTLASILSATWNVDCLRQFTQLGGLNYLCSLPEAQRCYIDVGDSSVEEIIIKILDALFKLPMKMEGYLACEIANKIQHLHCHKNVEIQAKAKRLSECWEKLSTTTVETEKSSKKMCHEYEHNRYTTETSPAAEDENSNSEWTITSIKGVSISGDFTRESTSSCKLQPSSSTCSSGVVHFKDVKDTKECTTETTSCFNLQTSSSTTSSRAVHLKDMKDIRGSFFSERNEEANLNTQRNIRSDDLKEITGIKTLNIAEVLRVSMEEAVSATVNSTKSKAHSETNKAFQQVVTKELDVKARPSAQENDIGDGKRTLMTVGLIEKHPKTEFSSSSLAPIMPPVSPLGDICQKAPLESETCNNQGHGITYSIVGHIKSSVEEHLLKDMVLDMEIDESSTYLNKSTPEKQTGSAVINDEKEGRINRASVNTETLPNYGTAKVSHLKSNLDVGAENSSTSSKVDMPKPRKEQTSGKTNEELLMESRYEPDSALEVAPEVANEADRDVEICKEISSSSSSMQDKNLEKVHFGGAHSMKRKYDCSIEAGQRSGLCTEEDIPEGKFSTKRQIGREVSRGNKELYADVSGFSQDIPVKTCETDGVTHEQQSFPLTRGPEAVAVPCMFDLNDDFRTEEVECPEQLVTTFPSSSHIINLSTPIPVVATRRCPPCLPTKPLHFEGELGWRGSALTSAFQPASFLKFSTKKKSLDEGKSASFRNLQSTHGINLNITDEGGSSVREIFPGKHLAMSSSLQSCDSSVEITARRAVRFSLDLNCTDNSDDACSLLSDWKMEYRHQLQGNVNKPSSASCSRTTVKDFDLNDNPSFDEAPEIHGLDRMVSDPPITIMGSKLPLGRGNTLSEHQHDFGAVQVTGRSNSEKDYQLSAQATEVAAHSATSSAEQIRRMVAIQPVVAYLSPHAFSYGGFGFVPSVAVPSACPSIIPFMDLQLHGATIKPQVYGPGMHYNSPRVPYLIDVVAETGVSEVRMSRPSLDLNAGFTSLDPETRAANPRYLFPSSNPLMDDQVNFFHQVPVSGSSMKRKEPECGWDPHQAGYRNARSWH